ncbi:tRNA (guanosine(46)-N7)-methyltransferase TrmB [Candidatus Zinderia endosymbiont of Aphrophora alni]|uniref:tRNA (guanosine(46)-N7)-methyltransferase TrmB n=1 Tax=Candidatus Zinderia endosymbiont of Aphrophora alni TaxID=3077951 RepID=UPI0030CBC363
MLKNYICSFVKRSRKLSLNQKKIFFLEKKNILPYSNKNINLNNIFTKKKKNILEIGFGKGEASIKIAKFMPEKNFICVDTYEKGIINLLKLIKKNFLSNIKIINYDAIYVLYNMFKFFSFFGIHIFFPDPWPKKKHKKRRFINKFSIKLIILNLKKKGYLHIVTDCEDYANYMLKILNKNIYFKNFSKEKSFIKEEFKPKYRFITSYEKKALNFKRKIFDLIFIKK